MAYELYVDVIPPEGGRIFVTHIFRGETEAQAREVMEQHAGQCKFLTPAIADDRVEETLVKIKDEDWPEGGGEPERDETEGEEEDSDDDPEDEDDE